MYQVEIVQFQNGFACLDYMLFYRSWKMAAVSVLGRWPFFYIIKSENVICAHSIILSQCNKMMDRQFVDSFFVTGINLLCCFQNAGDFVLLEMAVFA